VLEWKKCTPTMNSRWKCRPLAAKAIISCSVALIAVSATSPANAVQLYEITSWANNNLTNAGDPGKYVGFKFSVTTETWINSLSSWVAGAALVGLHQVSLYDVTSGQTLQRQIGITSSGPTPCSYSSINSSNTSLGGFCSKPILPFMLETGRTYSLSSSYSIDDGEQFLSKLNSTQVAFAAGVTFIENTISANVFPENPPTGSIPTTSPDIYGNFGPNMGFGGGPTPPSSTVPAPLPLAGASFAFGFSRKMRLRLAQTKV